jgi:nicotinate phosphoribosyltransferase
MISEHSPLLTDLYQLTMLQAYFDEGMDDVAVFEFFVRKLPQERNFLVAAGLEQVLHFLENLEFTAEEIDGLDRRGGFSKAFLKYLQALRFHGDVHAMPEGTVFFPNEPILRITAPISQAQLVETRIINLLHFQTVIASKAARCVLAAPGKLLVDFGLRRAHGAEAGLLAARASYIAGFSGTSTVLAHTLFGIPVYGTMAHSYIQAHSTEKEAFQQFARSQTNNVTLLIDTYDTEKAAQKVVEIAVGLQKEGIAIKAVRLDSGDLVSHAKQVRSILDKGALKDVDIFCSGSLDEHEVARLLAAGAPIDGFGIGTHLDTSSDAPYLDCAYKLQEYAGTARRKRSEGKATWPGRKQVYRQYAPTGFLGKDIVTIEADLQRGKPLIQVFMKSGKRLVAPETLETLRARAAAELSALPLDLRQLGESSAQFEIEISTALRELADSVDSFCGQ